MAGFRALIPGVNEIASLSPRERFNGLIEGLFNDVAREVPKGWVSIPMVTLIWRRLRRMRRRFIGIMDRLRAGTLVQAGAPRPAAPDRPAGSSRSKEPYREFGWVIYAVSWFVWGRHYDLEEMLEDGEVVGLVECAPELGSVLRPMCQMLAVKPPAWLRLPRKPRRSRAVPRPPAPDFVVNMPGAILKPDGSVWMRLGASTNWRKPDLLWDTLEQAQKFDRPVRIWPRRD